MNIDLAKYQKSFNISYVDVRCVQLYHGTVLINVINTNNELITYIIKSDGVKNTGIKKMYDVLLNIITH